MFSYTKRNVDTISLVISIVIFLIINNTYAIIKKSNFSAYFQSSKNQVKIEIAEKMSIEEETKEINDKLEAKEMEEYAKEGNEEKQVSENKTENLETKVENKDTNWNIEIPQISLNAQISEGVTKEVMNKYVGHFENTSTKEGNICLAAHNRGYPVNYFQNIKVLKEGDEIIYKYNNFEKTYVVDTIEIIEDTDWSYLENTEENRITLITCVENEPKYRRCIQGIEKS